MNNMNKVTQTIIISFTVLSLLLLGQTSPALAQDIEIVPPPTPQPPQEEIEDKRSWTKSDYKDLIQKAAKAYQIDSQLIYATIMTESRGDQYAYRYEPKLDDASMGLGQILVSTSRILGFKGNAKELYEPSLNIDLIARYYRLMLDKHGDLTLEQLVKAYNSGSPYKKAIPGHISKFMEWYTSFT